jgi:hypothetical protein
MLSSAGLLTVDDLPWIIEQAVTGPPDRAMSWAPWLEVAYVADRLDHRAAVEQIPKSSPLRTYATRLADRRASPPVPQAVSSPQQQGQTEVTAERRRELLDALAGPSGEAFARFCHAARAAATSTTGSPLR